MLWLAQIRSQREMKKTKLKLTSYLYCLIIAHALRISAGLYLWIVIELLRSVLLNLFGAPHDRKRRSLCIDVVSPASFKQRPRNASSIGIVGTLSITKNIVFQIPSYKSTQTQRYSLLNVKQSNHSLYSTRGCIDVGDGCWSRNVLATTLRCWWWFWPFMSPTSSII